MKSLLLVCLVSATSLAVQAQLEITLSCPANYEEAGCNTCRCKDQPDQPCTEGVWNTMLCSCAPVGRARPMPEDSVMTQFCRNSCPPGSLHNSLCECYTEDCSMISARECEDVRCGEDTESFCGLARKMADDSITLPRLFCAGCGCCSTGGVSDIQGRPAAGGGNGRNSNRNCNTPCQDMHVHLVETRPSPTSN